MQETPRKHIVLGKLVRAFIRAGWNPPPPSSRIAERLLEDIAERCDQPEPTTARLAASLVLTPQQRTALTLTALGMTGREAAEAMDVSHETLRTHLKLAKNRLGASTLAHAVAIGLSDEIIAVPNDGAPARGLAA